MMKRHASHWSGLAGLGVWLVLTGSLAAQTAPRTSASRAFLPPSPQVSPPGHQGAPTGGTPLFSSTGSNKVYYTDSNSVSPTTPFYEYDVGTDAWNQKKDLPGPNTTQLCSDTNGVVHALIEDGNIYTYDPTNDMWNVLMAGPSAAVGRRAISMFETYNGEFFWADDASMTLHFTKGGVWTTVAAPSPLSCAADVDHATGLMYVRVYAQLGFMIYDIANGTFTSCPDATTCFENSRTGTLTGGEFYTRDQASTYQAFDVTSCKKRDTLVMPTSTHSASAADSAGLIYSNGWNDDTVFEVYDTVGGSLTTLAAAPDILGNAHSTLVSTDLGCDDASWTNYGQGWPGTGGIPSIVSSADPVLGNSITISAKNSLGQATTGYLAIGYSMANMPTPFGGTMLVAPMFFWEVKIAASGYSNTGTLPNDPIFCGFDMYLQLMTRDVGASAGFSFTPGLQLHCGQ